MASNYTQLVFSLDLTVGELELFNKDIESLQEAMESQEEPDPGSFVDLVKGSLPGDLEDYAIPSFTVLSQRPGQATLHFTQNDDENPDMLDAILHAFLRRHQLPYVWGFMWWCSCSKPRVDGFGGGAVLVSKEMSRWISLTDWLEDKKNIYEVTRGRLPEGYNPDAT